MKIAASAEITEHEGATRFAFAPDGARFVVGDSTGNIAVRSSADGAPLVSAHVPPVGQYVKRASLTAIAWSPDGALIATIENATIVRLRRSDDLSIVSELDGRFGALDALAFGDGGAFLAVANRDLRIRKVPSLEEIRTMPIARKDLDTFDVHAVACAPSGSVVVTCDSGGYSEDENDVRTDSDAPAVGLFDISTGTVRWLAGTAREEDVCFDRWRDRIYTVSYELGTAVWSTAGALVRRWRPYESRRSGDYVPFARLLAVSEPHLATMPDRNARTHATIDLWSAYSFAHLASIDLPKDEEAHSLASSPDGTLLVTPMRKRGTVRDHGIRLCRVT